MGFDGATVMILVLLLLAVVLVLVFLRYVPLGLWVRALGVLHHALLAHQQLHIRVFGRRGLGIIENQIGF